MAVTLNILDKGQSAPLSTATSTLAWLGVSSAGNTPGTFQAVYQFSSVAVVAPSVGYGPGPEGVCAGIRQSATTQVFCRVNGGVPGVNSSVSQTGTSPLITLTGAPYDSYPLAKLQVVTQGALGAGQFRVAMDGATYGVTNDIPAQTAAAFVGTVDLTGFSYSGLGTTTLIVTPSNGVIETVTFASPATQAAMLTAINAVIGPANALGTVDVTSFGWTGLGTETLNFVMGDGTAIPVTFATPSGQAAALTTINTALGAHGTASVVTQGGRNYLRIQDALATTASLVTVNPGTANASLGLPATSTTYYGAQATVVANRFLKIVDGTTGTSSTLTMGSGTADGALGFTAGSTTGSAATYPIPNTGITATFPVGTYNASETYSWASTEPRFSTTDVVNALAALLNAKVPFRDVVLLCNPVDGTDTRSFANQLATSMAAWRSGAPRRFALAIMSSSVGAIGAIAANDNDVKAAMQGQQDAYVAVCHGDCFMQGTGVAGSFRRPAAFTIGIRAAAYPLSSDPGNHEQPALEETAMVGPDLATLARDEETATVKMQSQGFTTLTSDLGAAYCVQGLTRAPSSQPNFQILAVMRTAIESARILYVAGQRFQNANRKASPAGTLLQSTADAIKAYFEGLILAALSNDISDVNVTVDTQSIVTRTGQLNIQADIQKLAYFWNVNISEGIVDVLTTGTATAAAG